MKNIYVVRHCKAAGQAVDAPLTGEGVQQAKAIADFLADKRIDYVISSPFVRAYRTIQPLAERLNLPIVTDRRLSERVLSAHNHPDWREKLRNTYDDLELCYEGGESGRSAMGRAAAVIKEVMEGGHSNAVVVSHGNLISLLLKYYDDRIGYAEWEAMSNPDVYLLSFAKHSPAIRRIWTD